MKTFYFSGKNLENLDPRIRSVYNIIPPIILKTDFSDKPKLMPSKESNKSRRSILLHSSCEPYKYQTINVDTIRCVYSETLPNLIREDNIQDVIIIINYVNINFVQNKKLLLRQPVFVADIKATTICHSH